MVAKSLLGRMAISSVLICLLTSAASAEPHPPQPCGSLDLTSPLTQHCFPADGSHHFVCCEGISTPDDEESPHGNRNPLADVIAQASSLENPSWCTCSEEICTKQLHGRVAWNMQGAGWKGFRPRPRDDQL
jgi:hypothetical protein